MKPGLLLMCLFVAGRLAGADTLLPQSVARTNAPKPAVEPAEESPRNFQIKRGFRLELVASEPLVTDPIAMAFDENGRLFVIEAASHFVNGPVTGRVRVLEDNDGTGTFDSSTVYADNIANPTALACYGGGVFVAATGQVLFLKDTKGNGVADVRREVFKSFGEATNGANGQVIITGMAWGLDNRIHAVTAGKGGDVISSSSAAQSVVLSEGSFSFDPRTFLLAAESGSGASGLSFDDRGREFICTPTHHIEMVIAEPRWVTRNPYYTLPATTQNLRGLPATRLIYPPLRPGTIAPAPIRFSAAAGIAIYRGNAFPREYAGDAFVADAVAGVVHHDHIRFDGIEATLERPGDEQAMEFLANYDSSFHPTQVVNGPDGTLYVTGLTRETEVPVRMKTNATLATVAPARGRIYRVLPLNFKQPKFVPLGKLPAEQLVSMLRHPNGWQRDTASRLLYERQERTTIVPLIRLLFDPTAPPLARMHALRALDGIELIVAGHPTHALLESHLLKALTDPDDRVREQAVALSEKFLSKAGLWSDQLWGQLSQMGNDSSPQVRWRLALTLGQGHNPGRAQTLATLVRADVKTYPAVLSSLSDGAAEMLQMVASDQQLQNTDRGQAFLHELVLIVGRQNRPDEIARVATALQNGGPMAIKLAMQLEEGVAEGDGSLDAEVGPAVNPLYARAATLAADSTVDGYTRANALRFLATHNSVDPALAVTVVKQWPYRDKPSARQSLLTVLLSRPEWAGTVVAGLETELIARSELTTEQIRFLLGYPNATMRQQSAALFNNWSTLQRQPVVDRYRSALQLNPDAERGQKIFLANCQSCHSTADEPTAVSYTLSLANAGRLGKEKLLSHILNPTGMGLTTHPMIVLQTKTGELIGGFLAAQNAKCVTICDWQGLAHNIARSNVAGQSNLGISGMPEDWENTLNPQDMADLLEYLVAGRK
jgi:putative membrane-bound dehydrogenase-like protein